MCHEGLVGFVRMILLVFPCGFVGFVILGLIGFVMGFIGCVVRVLLGLLRGLNWVCYEGLFFVVFFHERFVGFVMRV